MNNLYLAFIERVKQVPKETVNDVSFFNEFLHNVKHHFNPNFIAKHCFPKECFAFLQKELPFIEKYSQRYHEQDIKETEVVITASFICSLNKQLYMARKLVDLMPVLIGYQFLKMDYRQFIHHKNFDKTNFIQLKVTLSEFFEAFKMNIATEVNSNYRDKQILELLNNGMENHDIQQIYEFVDAVERGIGFHIPYVFHSITKLIQIIDFEVFSKALNAKENTIDIISLIYHLELSEKEQLISNPTIDNKWCLYELLREILCDITADKISDSFFVNMSTALSKLAMIDANFFEHFIISHRINPHFSKILALSLGTLDKSYVDIYLRTIEMNTYHSNVENNRVLIHTLISSGNNENLYYLCKGIFEKWQELLQSLVQQQQYTNGIVYSSYYFGVLQYMLMEYTHQQLFDEIEQAIEEIEYHKYSWQKSLSGEQIHYFIGLTKLYILGNVFHERSLQWNGYEHLQKMMQKVLYNKQTWLWYFRETTKPEVIQCIDDFFCLQNLHG